MLDKHYGAGYSKHMDINTRTAEQLAKDLEMAHHALQAVVKILSVTTDDPQFYYEVGRASGAAKLGLIMSGAKS